MLEVERPPGRTEKRWKGRVYLPLPGKKGYARANAWAEVMFLSDNTLSQTKWADIHTHLLPNIDDGARSWEDSLAMLRQAVTDGTSALACTPHQLGFGSMLNPTTSYAPLLDELRERAQAAGIDIAIYPGGEVHCTPDVIDRLERGEAATLGQGGRYMLLEMPAAEVPSYAHQVVFDLLVRGITPVIAHPERNEAIMRQPELLVELVQAGALAQLTAASLSRVAGQTVLETAVLLVVHNLVHVIASDAHSQHKRPPIISRYAGKVAGVWGQARAQAMASSVPMAILNGQPVQVEGPLPITRQSRREAVLAARALVGGNRRSGLLGLLRAR